MTKASKNERKPEKGSRKAKKGTAQPASQAKVGERQQRVIIALMMALVLTVIIMPKGGLIPDYYRPGDVASRNIKAPRDLNVPAPPLTEKKRQQAEEAVRPIYDFDSRGALEIIHRLNQAIELLAQERPPGGGPATQQARLEESFGKSLSGDELSALVTLKSEPAIQEGVRSAIRDTLGQMIVGNLELFRSDQQEGVVVRDLATQQERFHEQLDQVTGLDQAQVRLVAQLKKVEGLPGEQGKALATVLARQLKPNLTFNRNETEERKQQARDAVNPVFYQVKKGEMIVREGERIGEDQVQILQVLRDIGSDVRNLRYGLGLLLIILVLVFVCHRFGRQHIRKYRLTNRDFLFMSMTLVGLFVLIKFGIFLSAALESAFPYIDSSSYYYAFPFAMGAMLVRMVLNSEIALIFSCLAALLLGVLFGNNLFIAIFVLASSLTGAHSVGHCEQRTSLYRAGLKVSLANLALIPVLHLVGGLPFDSQLLYKCAFGIAGGFFCAVFVNGTIPLVEALFKYTTDIKLLELANLNAPVLRELMVRAPGTYHHSIVVGNLVEAAAEAINANPLQARVAAYYHDIGKIRKPLYFIENADGSHNRHDKLAPSMSALILMSHIKDGVELAREHKLGKDILDVIRQHHGTSLIKFFYDKARNTSDPDVQQVDERDYRYPGPRPQTREAALIMLADAVEAASRTLADPTPARIQGMVQKIINNIFIDGQLDECELTLKDLHLIARSFNRILAGIFHHRIDYPEPAFKEREREGSKRKNGDDPYREPPAEPKDRGNGIKPGSPEDLKRLGMS